MRRSSMVPLKICMWKKWEVVDLRATNTAEAFHNRLNVTVRRDHPDMRTLLEKFKYMISKQNVRSGGYKRIRTTATICIRKTANDGKKLRKTWEDLLGFTNLEEWRRANSKIIVNICQDM
ncbi:hypothetical protein GCK32_009759 [Trichostrongylus colubriformis]|uniref:Uncharacterized protein n=1 Tax=Trichostrongylus colubriformis TaxID=6319 RepID=A0AAN8ICR5_TRICO